MKKTFLLLSLLLCLAEVAAAQQALPRISVENFSNNIIISWKNDYTQTVTNINIQRSYDSLKNFTTIGSVLNPQSKENGYSDNQPPYNKMYYRVFIAFEGGAYIISPSVRPVKVGVQAQADSFNIPKIQVPPVVSNPTTSPSMRVFTAKDNNLVIQLPDALIKEYSIKFFNEARKELFELKNLKEDYLIIEKVNFGKSGHYSFELYESGRLIEKNVFFIPKDGKIDNN